MAALRSILKNDQPQSSKAAFLAADYDTVIILLDADRSPEGDEILTQAYMRMGLFEDAIRVLDGSPIGNSGMGLGLRAAVESRRGRYDAAQEYLDRAVPANNRERDRICFEQAMLAFCRLDTDKCEKLLAQPMYSLQQQADELRGWVLVRRMKLREAAEMLERAASGPDLWTRYNALSSASFIAREMYLPTLMQRIEDLANVEPPRHLAKFQCHILRASGWFLALEGRFEETLRRFRRAARYASSDAWKIALLVDRGYVSLAFGNSENGWDDLDEAVDIARKTNWKKSQGEERRVLLTIAALLADKNLVDAKWCMNEYLALKPTDGLSEWSRDIRSAAFENYALGSVYRAEGRIQESQDCFGRAFSAFHKIGYDWRAMLTLVARRESIYSRVAVPEYVKGVLERYPKSWFRSLVETQMHLNMEPTDFDNLTTMERRVLVLLAEGKTNRQIADALGRAEQTIADHVTQILRKTNCSSRKELIRQCAMGQ